MESKSSKKRKLNDCLVPSTERTDISNEVTEIILHRIPKKNTEFSGALKTFNFSEYSEKNIDLIWSWMGERSNELRLSICVLRQWIALSMPSISYGENPTQEVLECLKEFCRDLEKQCARLAEGRLDDLRARHNVWINVKGNEIEKTKQIAVLSEHELNRLHVRYARFAILAVRIKIMDLLNFIEKNCKILKEAGFLNGQVL